MTGAVGDITNNWDLCVIDRWDEVILSLWSQSSLHGYSLTYGLSDTDLCWSVQVGEQSAAAVTVSCHFDIVVAESLFLYCSAVWKWTPERPVSEDPNHQISAAVFLSAASHCGNVRSQSAVLLKGQNYLEKDKADRLHSPPAPHLPHPIFSQFRKHSKVLLSLCSPWLNITGTALRLFEAALLMEMWTFAALLAL